MSTPEPHRPLFWLDRDGEEQWSCDCGATGGPIYRYAVHMQMVLLIERCAAKEIGR